MEIECIFRYLISVDAAMVPICSFIVLIGFSKAFQRLLDFILGDSIFGIKHATFRIESVKIANWTPLSGATSFLKCLSAVYEWLERLERVESVRRAIQFVAPSKIL